MSLRKADYIRALVNRANALGIFLLVDTDGRLKAYPSDVVRKHPQFMLNLSEYREGIKKWLTILAGPMSHGI